MPDFGMLAENGGAHCSSNKDSEALSNISVCDTPSLLVHPSDAAANWGRIAYAASREGLPPSRFINQFDLHRCGAKALAGGHPSLCLATLNTITKLTTVAGNRRPYVQSWPTMLRSREREQGLLWSRIFHAS